MDYPIDVGRLILVVVFSLGLPLYLFFKRKGLFIEKKEEISYIGPLAFFVIGLPLLTISVLSTWLVIGHWDSDAMLAYLCFKIITKDNSFIYYLRTMAYTYFFSGVVLFIIEFIAKEKRHKRSS